MLGRGGIQKHRLATTHWARFNDLKASDELFGRCFDLNFVHDSSPPMKPVGI